MKRCIVGIVAVMLLGSGALADIRQIIDFEDAAVVVPGGDDAPVSTQYLAEFGVTFSMLAGPTKLTAVPGLPTFEDWGALPDDPNRGFWYDGSYGGDAGYDREGTPAAGGLGDWFLKSGNDVANTGYVKLIIDYSVPVHAASGEIWDIDGAADGNYGTEQWEVKAYDAAGAVVASILSPNSDDIGPFALDGLPWSWDLGSDADIVKIEIEFVGSKTEQVGLAFDNFSPAIPEPGTLALLALSGLAYLRRR